MMAFADSMVLILVLTLGNIAEWISIGHIHEHDNTLYEEIYACETTFPTSPLHAAREI
jgi:hypothetical protein